MSAVMVVATLVAAAFAIYLIHKDGYDMGREHGRNEQEKRSEYTSNER